MKRALVASLVIVGTVALVLGWYQRDDSTAGTAPPPIVDTVIQETDEPGEAGVTSESARSKPRAPGNGDERAPTAEQLARAAYDQSIVKKVLVFRDDLQSFIREAELLPAQDHEPKARELLAEVDLFSATGYLTGPEALALQLSLLKYALPADEYRATADKLVSDARQRAEEAEREWAARSDPKLEHYRSEERRIVEEAATMDEYPEGMTQQAYLRQRLMELRSEIFSE